MTEINRVGTTQRIFATLLSAGVPVDPDTLRIEITNPALATTEYHWNTDPEVVRDSTGTFHFDLFLTAPGTWTFEWYSNASLTAFKQGTIEVAWPLTITTQDDQGTPVPVPFVTVNAWETATGDKLELLNGQELTRSDASGDLVTALPPGSYRFTAYKLGWIFENPTLADFTGPGPFTLALTGRLLQSNWLQWEDLEGTVDSGTVDRLFQADANGIRDMRKVEDYIQQAEALAESKLRRAWKRAEDIYTVARADRALRTHAAWLAIELATEAKQEFVSADGKGRYWAQYERAMEYFDDLSKSKIETRGNETGATKNANVGGQRKPQVKSDEAPFVFAPDKNGNAPGGF